MVQTLTSGSIQVHRAVFGPGRIAGMSASTSGIDGIDAVTMVLATWDDLGRPADNLGDARRRGPRPAPALQAEEWRVVLQRPRRGAPGAPARADGLWPPEADRTSGLVAYLDDEPVGWCAVEPRPAYTGLVRDNRVPCEGRQEDGVDTTVWAPTLSLHPGRLRQARRQPRPHPRRRRLRPRPEVPGRSRATRSRPRMSSPRSSTSAP